MFESTSVFNARGLSWRLLLVAVIAVLACAIAVAHCGLIPATTIVRAPSHDSAIIKSERLGGNFAYSSVEGHAYAAISPIVTNVAVPAAVSYTAHPVAVPAAVPVIAHGLHAPLITAIH